MSSLKALNIICNVLSFKYDTLSLKTTFKEENVDWELIVKIASKHLVLPAFYCRLQARELVHLIPNDLENYLKEITNLNYKRNKKLLEEVTSLSSILKQNNIDHVFLKGSAMLALNGYDTIAERMVGDIDILIEDTKLNTAFNLIKKEKYTPVKLTLGSKYFEHKHLPRLIPEKALMAIEIHKRLLKANMTKYLNPKEILSDKTITKNGINIPNKNHLMKHVIYNYQINDDGHYYGTYNLRSLFDSITLSKTEDTLAINKNKYTKSFFLIGSVLFNDLKDYSYIKNSIKKNLFLFRLKNKIYMLIHYKILKLIFALKTVSSRTYFFLRNSGYRKDILKDRNRIFNLIFKGKAYKSNQIASK